MVKKKKKLVELDEWAVISLQDDGRWVIHRGNYLKRGDAIATFGKHYRRERRAGRYRAVKLCARI